MSGEAYGNGSVVGGFFEHFSGVLSGAGVYTNMGNPTKTGYDGFSGIKLDLSSIRTGDTTRTKQKGVTYIVKVL